MSQNLNCKEAEFVTEETSLKFNGANISRYQHHHTNSQAKRIEKFNMIDNKNDTAANYVAGQTQGAYIVAVWRLDTACAFSAAFQITNPNVRDFRMLNKVIILMFKKRTQESASYFSASLRSS